MDPLNAIASVITILQLSAEVLAYLNNVKDAPESWAQCLIEASNLHNLLTNLRFRLEEGHSYQPWFSAVQALAVENGPLDQFKQALETLQAKMTDRGRLKAAREALLWKFKKEEVDAILARMERLKTLVEIALQMDHFKLSQAIKDGPNYAWTRVPVVQSRVDEIRQDQDVVKHRRILGWISPTDYPAQQSDIIAHRQKGTGQWFLDAPQVATWLSEYQSTLFCPGIPGAGKTMVAAIAIDYLLESVQSSSHGVAYVYCNYKAQDEQDISGLLAAILKQLVHGRPLLAKPVEQLHKQHANRETRPSLDEVFSALQDVLAHYSTIYIVVDALDECHGGIRRQFLAKLRNLQAGRDVRLMATSRFIPEIMDAFNEALKLEVQASEADVKRFVAGQLDRLPRCIRRDPALQEIVQEKIVEAVDGMFLLARLHTDSLLDKKTVKDVKSTLAKLSKGSAALDVAYTEAIQRIQGQLSGDYQLAKKVLSWITYAKRPLTTNEICCALAVELEEVELDPENIPNIEDLLSVCAGLVVVDRESAVIRLVHYTTQEYFERIRDSWDIGAQLHIASTCLTYLSFSIFKTGSCSSDEEFEERLQDNEFLDYAAKHWGEHAAAVEDQIWELACSFLSHSELVSCAAQVMAVSEQADRHPGYSQAYPTKTAGLHLTARFGLPHLSRKLLAGLGAHDGIEADLKDQYGRTPLSYAAGRGHKTVVSLLVEQKTIDGDSRDQDGRTPLSWASKHGHDQVVKLLLQRNANPNLKDAGGRSPLHWAASSGHETIVDSLIKSGTLIDSMDKDGSTPLHESIREDHEAVQKLLIELGADLDIKDGDGQTASDLAWSKKRLDSSAFSLDDLLTATINQGFQARCEVLRRKSGGKMPQVIFHKKFDVRKRRGKYAKKCLFREYRTLQKLDHPFIVSYLGYEEDLKQNTASLYMEFCDGGDLETTHVLKRSDDEDSDDSFSDITTSHPIPLQADEVWSIVFQLAAAMAYLHHGLSMKDNAFSFERHWRSVIHRDIKPANVVLTTLEDGRKVAKLCDLGLVRDVDDAKQTKGPGSRFYSPPEVKLNEDWTLKGDIYSFGVTIDELYKVPEPKYRLTEMLERCKSEDQSLRPSSLSILETACENLSGHERNIGDSLHKLLGSGPGGYLLQALEFIASGLDDYADFSNERRRKILNRLELLCKDGAVDLFDEYSESLHLSVLLDRQDKLKNLLSGGKKSDVNKHWPNSGWTPLHLAFQENREHMVSLLIGYGANSEALDRYRRPPKYYRNE